MIRKLINRVCAAIVSRGLNYNKAHRYLHLKLDPSVRLGDVNVVHTNLQIGKHSYMNSGRIATAPDARVTIGRWCRLGYNVRLLAIGADSEFPTGPLKYRKYKKGNVTIGDGVWICDDVIILQGVTVGDFAIIGANSVVREDVPPFGLAVGTPARIKRIMDEEERKENVRIVRQTDP